ncbi:hypothetical protein CDEF62S_04308 [Castellaniella defragrans]
MATKKLRKMTSVLLLAAGVLALGSGSALAAGFGNCEVAGPDHVATLKTLSPDTLTVRPYLPSPGFWNGNSLDSIKDGFEYCLAANIAHRAGLHDLKLVSVSFAQVVAGQADAFDIALSQITITDERKKVVDFTVPYFDVLTAAMVRKGTQVTADAIKNDLRIGVERGTTMFDFVKETIKPSKDIKVFSDSAGMYSALAARQVDVVLYDASSLLGVAASSEGRFVVAGVYPDSEMGIGGVVGKKSPNLEAFDKILTSLKSDGTIDKLEKQYLSPAMGGKIPSELPLIK